VLAGDAAGAAVRRTLGAVLAVVHAHSFVAASAARPTRAGAVHPPVRDLRRTPHARASDNRAQVGPDDHACPAQQGVRWGTSKDTSAPAAGGGAGGTR
jgi:hypothetical protein